METDYKSKYPKEKEQKDLNDLIKHMPIWFNVLRNFYINEYGTNKESKEIKSPYCYAKTKPNYNEYRQ